MMTPRRVLLVFTGLFAAATSTLASYSHNGHASKIGCLRECEAAQKEFAVARGIRTTVCSCDSQFLRKVDACAACLIFQDVWRYLTPWVGLIMYCNPRKEDCDK